MLALFIKGGPIMWPLLITSIVALATVIERTIFLVREHRRRDEPAIDHMFSAIERHDYAEAVSAGRASSDPVARVLTYALTNRGTSISNALLRASSVELQRYNRGLSVLDTIITLAPLLGLLGTVTGMIGAFGLLGGSELDAPAAITGGIAEALIATAFGLGIAIVSLIPFNYLNSKLDAMRHEIEDRATQLELLTLQPAPAAVALHREAA